MLKYYRKKWLCFYHFERTWLWGKDFLVQGWGIKFKPQKAIEIHFLNILHQPQNIANIQIKFARIEHGQMSNYVKVTSNQTSVNSL